MWTVWKIPIEELEYKITLKLPAHSKLLFVAVDPKTDCICIWAQVENATVDEDTAEIYIVGTGGQKVPTGRHFRYFGSVIQDGFVWHFYTEYEIAR